MKKIKKIKKILLFPLSKTLTLKFVVNENYLHINMHSEISFFYPRGL